MGRDVPDFAGLIRAARARRTPVPIGLARELLGDLFDERALDQETLVIRAGMEVALTPSAWVRMICRARIGAGRDRPRHGGQSTA